MTFINNPIKDLFLKIKYTVTISAPHLHYYEIELKYSTKAKEVELCLPAWTPGSYMIRNYSSHIHIQGVIDASGEELSYRQNTIDSWLIFAEGKSFSFRYRVYSYERSVRTNFLSSDYGFINSPAVFMYPKNRLGEPSQIRFNLNRNFKHIYTSLQNHSKALYLARNFDELFDSPFLLTNNISYNFEAGGCNHEIVFLGDIAEAKKNQIVTDLRNICQFEIDYMGGTQNNYYLFMIDLIDADYGGLEHSASSVNMFDPGKLHDRDEYLKLLSLLAHEYFHLWNGKRIRPEKIAPSLARELPFDYQNPVLTGDLWMVEGITSFYDNYILLLTGYLSPEVYLSRILSDMQILEKSSGEEWMSLDESSITAWTKFYKGHGDSHNTNISYYVKGAILVLCMEIRILTETAGKKRFIDILRALYVDFYLNGNKAITRKDFFDTALTVTGINLKDEFEGYINQRKRIPVIDYLNLIGVDRLNTDEAVEFGFQAQLENGKIIIKRIFKNQLNADINLGDELLAVNHIRVGSMEMLAYIKNSTRPYEEIELILARKGKIIFRQIMANSSFRQSVLFLMNGVSEQTSYCRKCFFEKVRIVDL